MRLRAIALRLCSAFLLAACSAGDSGGDDGTPEVVITTDDADVAAAEVMRGLLLSTDFTTTSTGPGGSSVEAAATARVDLRAVSGGGVTPAFQVPPTTRTCAAGGSVTIAGDVAVAGTLTEGDQIESDFDDCRQVDGGPLLNGSLDFTVIVFTGDLDDGFALQADTDLIGFSLDDGDVETIANGNADLIQDTRAPLIRQVEMRNGSVTFAQGDHEITLALFDNISSTNTATLEYELTGRGTLVTSLFGTARMDYQVLQPLEGVIPGEPSEGQLLIAGADGATVLLTAQGANVELEVDLDGEDGPLEPETLPPISWAALYAATPTAPPP
jgi:hypothetical protein